MSYPALQNTVTEEPPHPALRATLSPKGVRGSLSLNFAVISRSEKLGVRAGAADSSF